MGAVFRAAHELLDGKGSSDFYADVRATGKRLERFNDREARTVDDVIAVLERAKKRLGE